MLAAVVFLIGLKLVDIAGMREILRLRRDEFYVAVATAIVVVAVGVEQGIILAIVLSLLLHVRRHYEPVDVVLAWDEHHHVRTLPPGRRGHERARARRLPLRRRHLLRERAAPLRRGARARRRRRPRRGGSSSTRRASTTSTSPVARPSERSPRALKEIGVQLAVADVRDSVRAELDRYGLTSMIGEDRIFETIGDAVEAFHAENAALLDG